MLRVFKNKKYLIFLNIMMLILFVLTVAVKADDDEEDDDYQPSSSSSSSTAQAKPVTTTTRTTQVVILKDSDGDGILDRDDLHPTIAEIYMVEDANFNGIVDKFEQGASDISLALETKVDYKEDVIVDSDLDGLTDQGEIQIYHTDSQDPDMDGDGILDGVEVIGKANPLDATSPSAKEITTSTSYMVEKETPWAWYLTRASALLGFLLLYISFVLGLSIRIPVLNKIIKPIYSFEIHCWISLQALVFALIHGIILLFDKMVGFGWQNIFIPFYSGSQNNAVGINPQFLGLGIIGFYVMFILVLSSYLKKFISQHVWRGLHFLNIGLFVAVFIHSLYLGTDLKNETFRAIFIIANFLLLVLIAINLLLRVTKPLFRKEEDTTNYESTTNIQIK